MIDRRTFLAGTGAVLLAAPLAAEEGPPNRFSVTDLPPSDATRLAAFREGLGELGYVEGQNIAIESRWAEGNYDRLPGLAAELVRLKVDVIVTYGTPASQAAKRATGTIPIVMRGLLILSRAGSSRASRGQAGISPGCP